MNNERIKELIKATFVVMNYSTSTLVSGLSDSILSFMSSFIVDAITKKIVIDKVTEKEIIIKTMEVINQNIFDTLLINDSALNNIRKFYFISFFQPLMIRSIEKTIRKIASNLPKKAIDANTIVGFMAIKRAQQFVNSLILILATSIIYLCLSIFQIVTPNLLAVLFLILITLIIIANHKAYEYRIDHGFFGNNEFEAREIIKFIISKSNNSDLINGGKFPKLFPEVEIEGQAFEKEVFQEGLIRG